MSPDSMLILPFSMPSPVMRFSSFRERRSGVCSAGSAVTVNASAHSCCRTAHQAAVQQAVRSTSLFSSSPPATPPCHRLQVDISMPRRTHRCLPPALFATLMPATILSGLPFFDAAIRAALRSTQSSPAARYRQGFSPLWFCSSVECQHGAGAWRGARKQPATLERPEWNMFTMSRAKERCYRCPSVLRGHTLRQRTLRLAALSRPRPRPSLNRQFAHQFANRCQNTPSSATVRGARRCAPPRFR